MSNDPQITILAVDDNEAVRYSLARCLQAGGYRVIEARTGEEALNMAENSPDLITLDVHLPDTSGFEVCRRLKSNPNTAHIPVLHISATFVDADDRVRGLESADGYLAEPISREELLATIAALLRLKRAERQASLHALEAERARAELKEAHDELERRVEQRTQQLAKSNAENRELTGRLLKLQDDERRRLARELHDSTGQLLTAMKMNLDRLKSGTILPHNQPLIQEIGAINDDLARQLRTMSYLLHPPLLDEVGLTSAISWYVEGFTQRSAISVDLQMNENFPRLPQDVELVVFRVVQESLTNIHRHSGSATATVSLAKTPESIQVVVRDSGRGIPRDRFRGNEVIPGVGIMGIRERLWQLGGIVEITSSDTGTTVTATIPMKDGVS